MLNQKPDLTSIIPQIIVVGSTNPVKIQAVKNTFSSYTSRKLSIISHPVSSGVNDQPYNDEETRQGAINRAIQSLKVETKAEWGIGLEGGVRKINYLYHNRKVTEIIEVAWCAIATKSGQLALGGGAEFQLPPIITQRLEKGEELGPIMDNLLQETDVKKKQGAVGTLSNNLLIRQKIYEHLVKLALVKIISLSTRSSWWKRNV